MFQTINKEKIYTGGFSAIDISTGKNYVHKIKSSIEDKKIWNDELYRLIQYYNPKEILLHYHNDEFNFTKEILSQMWSFNDNNIHINQKIENKQFLKPSYQNEFLKKYFPQSDFLSPIEYLGFDRENELIILIFICFNLYMNIKLKIHYHHKPEFKENNDYLLLSHNCIEQLNVIQRDTSEKYGHY